MSGVAEPVIVLADLLDEIRDYFARYVVVDEPAPSLVALWVAHTYVYELGRATPYLNFVSPEPGSGKTLALEVAETVACKAMMVGGISAPALFRMLHSAAPTVLYDEIDAVFGPKVSESGEAIRQVLNNGYTAGKQVWRCEGNSHKVKAFNVYGPKAISGLRGLPGTLAHRSFTVHMKPALPSELHHDFDPEEVEAEARKLREALQQWADDPQTQAALTDPARKPEKLDELDARRNQIARPLLRIADLGGGHWPVTARSAVITFGSTDSSSPQFSTGLQLLLDIREVFDGDWAERDRLSCAELCEELNSSKDMAYQHWNEGSGIGTRELGRKLAAYQIKANTLRHGGEKIGNGYKRAQFEDSWRRYCPERTGTTGTTGSQTQETATPEPGHDEVVPVSENGATPHGQTVVPVVPVSGGDAEPEADW